MYGILKFLEPTRSCFPDKFVRKIKKYVPGIWFHFWILEDSFRKQQRAHGVPTTSSAGLHAPIWSTVRTGNRFTKMLRSCHDSGACGIAHACTSRWPGVRPMGKSVDGFPGWYKAFSLLGSLDGGAFWPLGSGGWDFKKSIRERASLDRIPLRMSPWSLKSVDNWGLWAGHRLAVKSWIWDERKMCLTFFSEQWTDEQLNLQDPTPIVVENLQ